MQECLCSSGHCWMDKGETQRAQDNVHLPGRSKSVQSECFAAGLAATATTAASFGAGNMVTCCQCWQQVVGPRQQGSQQQELWGRGCFGRGLTKSCLQACNSRDSSTASASHCCLTLAGSLLLAEAHQTCGHHHLSVYDTG
jgi:hypothetical protein